MDIPKCRSISSSRSKKGQLRRSARILPIVVVPTQLTPTRLTRNLDSSPPHRRPEGVRVRCRRYRASGKRQTSRIAGGYAQKLARTLPRRIRAGAGRGRLLRTELEQLQQPGIFRPQPRKLSRNLGGNGGHAGNLSPPQGPTPRPPHNTPVPPNPATNSP